MPIVAPDDFEHGRPSRRRSNDDVVDDGHVAAGGCDRSRGQPENVSSVFCEIVKKTIAEHSTSWQCSVPVRTRSRNESGVGVIAQARGASPVVSMP